MFIRCSIIILVVIVALSSSALLPEYFEKCSLSDPNLNKCLTKNTIKAWPLIVKGDKNVHLQSLDPLYVSFLHTTVYHNLIANASNVIIKGLADSKIEEIKLDQNKRKIDVYFLTPRFNIYGKYNMKGQLIHLQLDGEGTANNTFYNFHSHLQIEYELTKKKDEHYIEPIKSSMVYNITLLDLQLDSFGDTVNKILNDNWEAVNNEISESFGNIINEVFTEVLKHFFKKVSFEELFSK